MKSDIKKEDIQHITVRICESLKKKWETKVMHGQYVRSIDRQLSSEEDTFLWLSRGDVKGGTESEIVAAQDEALQTKYHAICDKNIRTETDSKCRLCKQLDETVEHVVSECPILAREQYIKRHDRICAQPHFNIRQENWVKSLI